MFAVWTLGARALDLPTHFVAKACLCIHLYTLGPLELFQSPDLAAEEESMKLVEQTELHGNLTLEECPNNVKAAKKCSATPKDCHTMIIHFVINHRRWGKEVKGKPTDTLRMPDDFTDPQSASGL